MFRAMACSSMCVRQSVRHICKGLLIFVGSSTFLPRVSISRFTTEMKIPKACHRFGIRNKTRNSLSVSSGSGLPAASWRKRPQNKPSRIQEDCIYTSGQHFSCSLARPSPSRYQDAHRQRRPKWRGPAFGGKHDYLRLFLYNFKVKVT